MNKKQVISFLKKNHKKKYTFDELSQRLSIKKHKQKNFRKLLRLLSREGEVIRKGNLYCFPKEEDFLSGTVTKHPRGFAFVIPDDPTVEDVFLNPREAHSLMEKDRVKVSIKIARDGRINGKLIKILERGQSQVVGIFVREDNNFFIIPHGVSEKEELSSRVFVAPKDIGDAKEGEIVVGKITRYPEKNRTAKGIVVKVLGDSRDPKLDTDIIIYKHDLPHEFTSSLIKAAEKIPTKVLKEDSNNRKDLRSLPFVTIDGETARDFDDAVYVEKTDKGYKLWVSIADVSHYVKEGGEIDQEAWKRGNSVYFPDRCVPMLPESLSNEICSLKPKVDRLAFTCEMSFDNYGNRKDAKVYESVINSHNRLTYTEVFELMNKKQDKIPHLPTMVELFRLIKKNRASRGSLDFDLPEGQIILDATGETEQIIKAPRNDSHMLIEEFMISANEAVGEMIEDSKTPGVYRVHEPPSEETLALFQELLHNLGYKINLGGKVSPKDLEKIIEQVSGKPEERLINTVLLRSLKQACYQRENLGHFGLASKCYSHFTSPIRRYPDLLLHRLLKNLKKTINLSDKHIAEVQSNIDETALQSSKTERLALSAEREVIALKKCRYMMDKVGNEYWGYIEGIAEFGMFIELEDMFVEGLVRFNTLEDDHYIFVEKEYVARGRRTNRAFRLGDRVKVRVDAVKLHKREIDFTLLETE